MRMPFGKQHKGKELDTLPDGYLRWILREIKTDPPLTVNPENREQYARTRRLLRYEADRILQERRRTGVTVRDPKYQERRHAHG